MKLKRFKGGALSRKKKVNDGFLDSKEDPDPGVLHPKTVSE